MAKNKYDWFYWDKDVSPADTLSEEIECAYSVTLKDFIDIAKEVHSDTGNYQCIKDKKGKIVFEIGDRPSFMAKKKPKAKKVKKIPGLNIKPERVRFKDPTWPNKTYYAYRLQDCKFGNALLYLPPRDKDEVGCFSFARKNDKGVYEQIKPTSLYQANWMNVE